MKEAVKNKTKTVKAWQLGGQSEMEQQLIKEGRIIPMADGNFRLLSQESKEGQIAKTGDFFKVDCKEGVHYPYPNDRDTFLSRHILLDASQNLWEQIPSKVLIWQQGDEMAEEVRFAMEKAGLKLNPQDPDHYFSANLWGDTLSAPFDSVLVFYAVERDENGQISSVDFNFVRRFEFDRDYTICQMNQA